MKKILVIGLTERMGGVETFIYNTTRFSDKSKFEYDFLCHGTDHTFFQDEITEFYNGVKHFYFVPSFKRQPIASYKALNNFFRAHASEYAYVHLETGATSEIIYVLPFVKKYNLKVITHSHNGNGYSPVINSLFRPAVNKVSIKELSCSKEATDWLFGSAKESDVEIINNGIDTHRFTFDADARKRIRRKYKLTENDLVIGHIGRFSEQKNHKFILQVFAEVLKMDPNARLMLIGTGELENEVKRQAKDLAIFDRVIWAGIHNNTEDYYSAFDVFFMPSLYEGLPVVGIESQSEGLPCVFSDQITQQLAITDLCEFKPLNDSVSDWSRSILSKRNAGEKRRLYAKKVAEAGYSIEATIKQLEKVYEV